ncbi:hypothetical protein AUK22_05505 [bacterium CG2_30_54_10]|nr:MAG: hypothetical protein AUK22_05505 [bacterium CG2_30_54_10]
MHPLGQRLRPKTVSADIHIGLAQPLQGLIQEIQKNHFQFNSAIRSDPAEGSIAEPIFRIKPIPTAWKFFSKIFSKALKSCWVRDKIEKLCCD